MGAYIERAKPFLSEWFRVLVVLLTFLLPINLATSGIVAVDSWQIVHPIGWRIFWGSVSFLIFLTLLASPFFWARNIWGSRALASWQKWMLCLWMLEMIAVLPLFGHNTAIAVCSFLAGF